MSDHGYYTRRLEEERRFATTAADEATARVHRQLAELYAQKLAALEASKAATPR